MRALVAASALLVGCGRINFDPLAAGSDSGSGVSEGAVDACIGGGVWSDGEVVTYSQAAWHDDATASAVLAGSFATVYASSGFAEVGTTTGFSMQFSSAAAVEAYLPASGPAAALDANLVDPISSPSGAFGGDVLALQLDVDFADAGITTGTSAVQFGDLTLCGFTAIPALNGMTVRQFLATSNTLLSGSSTSFAIADIAPIEPQLADAFLQGVPCAFAAQHMVAGTCP